MNVRPETIKLLEENISGKLQDISLGDDFLDMIPKGKGDKSKNKQLELQQTIKLLHSKGNHQQNICKSYS